MPLDPTRLFALRIPPRPLTLSAKDAILYALCCGARELPFLYEGNLSILPSFGQNLCFNDDWIPTADIELAKVVHGGLDLRFHRPMAPAERVEVKSRIAGVVDKGEGKPALILHVSDVEEDGEVIFTSRSNLFVMQGGGFGGGRGEVFEAISLPGRAPDLTAELVTDPHAPHYFRLLGDLNPLHILPEVAQAAGFPRPIMHGANTFGMICHDIVARICGNDVARLKRLTARFSGPLYPGEHLEISYWREGEQDLFFKVRNPERDMPVLDGGYAQLSM